MDEHGNTPKIRICALPAHISISKERMAEVEKLLREELRAYQDRVVASVLGAGTVKRYPSGVVTYLAEVKS